MDALEKHWYETATSFERYILAGDIGGTHTNLALYGQAGRNLSPIMKTVYATQEVERFSEPLSELLEELRSKSSGLIPSMACISVAGPVHENYCRLTNADWAVDGGEMKKSFGLETRVINDFLALSYSIPLLDLNDEKQVVTLSHTDGSTPTGHGEVMAVLGAGTGLGTGFLVRHGDDYRAYPSEGGHSDFSGHDEDSLELQRFVQQQYAFAPGSEPFIAGRGLTNIFNFRKSRGLAMEGALAEIDAAPESEKPALISKAASDSNECRSIMEHYVSLYARYAARAALMYLPTGGLFIAGGIAAKNLEFFVEEGRFMRVFEKSYKENIHAVLMQIPVHVVVDYSISLLGAANAARVLMQ